MNINKFLTILLSAVTVLLASCKDSESLFTPSITADSLTFRPIAGGAVCHYVLPDDPDVVGINLRYKDFKGDPILRTGSVFCDSLVLVGFNKATDNIEVKASLCRRDGRSRSRSQPISRQMIRVPMLFSTVCMCHQVGMASSFPQTTQLMLTA